MNSTKSQIINVALKMVSEKGYEWLSFQKIANEVGISKSSVYHYFKKKEDLGIEIVNMIGEEFRKEKEKFLIYKSEKEKIEGYLTEVNRKDHLYNEVLAKLTFDFNGLSLKLQKKIKEISEIEYNFILDVLKKGVEKNEFKIKNNLEETATAIILMTIGIYLYARIFSHKQKNFSKYIIENIIY